MPFIEVEGLGDDYEDVIVPESSYNLRVIDAKDQRNKENTCDQILCLIKVEDSEYPNPATIFHYLTFPGPGDDTQKRRDKMRFVTRFLKTFNVAFEKNGVNSEDITGSTASSVLVKQDDYEGVTKNVIQLAAIE